MCLLSWQCCDRSLLIVQAHVASCTQTVDVVLRKILGFHAAVFLFILIVDYKIGVSSEKQNEQSPALSAIV